MSKIELVSIDKFYEKNHVLKDLNLTIEDGDFMTLLGPSGCGKSTTLRIIAGLEQPEHGSVFIDGTEVVNCKMNYFAPPKKRDLNLVFQSYALWPHMNVFENVAFGLKVKKLPKDAIQKMVKRALEQMQILELEKRYPNELSGGQQQRVAIARAIAFSPKLLLMDEPLSNLDAKLRMDMRMELNRLHKELGTTIVYVTHDQVEALTMSTKIAVFSNGTLSQLSSPKELYQNPIDLDNAEFIGNPKYNFLEGYACKKEADLKASCALGEFQFQSADITKEQIPSGNFRCVFGIRPELLKIVSRDQGGVPAIVKACQFAGSETLISIGIENTKEKKADELLVKEIGTIDYTIGQKVALMIQPNQWNVFHQESKKLIKYAR